MRFICFGLGAVGTYIGGSLMEAGYKGVFIERPVVAEKVLQRGLRLQLSDGLHLIPQVEVVSSVDEALQRGDFDVAILAVKSYDTEPVAQAIYPYRQEFPPVFCLQNGVENEGVLKKVLGEEKVIPGTLTSAVGRGAEGEIFLERLRGVGLISAHPLAPALYKALWASGLKPCYCHSADGMKWTKMMTNLTANASSAILNMTPAEIFDHPGLYWLEMEQLRECLRVMRRLKIPVVNLPGVPSVLLGIVVRYFPIGLSRLFLRKAVERGRGAKMPSFHIDLYSGRAKSEVDYLNGAVVRFGKQCGVETPVNAILTHVLLAMTTGEISSSAYAGKPEKLLALLNQ